MTSHTVSSRSAPARILLVDNDPDVRAILQQCIEMRGHGCEFACDGQDGLERIQEALGQESLGSAARDGIDVVLLDLRMPRLDGRELLAALRPWCVERDLLARVPRFVVISGFVSQDDRDFLEGEDFVARIFKKPFDFVELLDCVDELLAARRPAAQLRAAGGDDPGPGLEATCGA